jgi:hypothetical protein
LEKEISPKIIKKCFDARNKLRGTRSGWGKVYFFFLSLKSNIFMSI